jgi:hypothetical protein
VIQEKHEPSADEEQGDKRELGPEQIP